MRSDVAIILLIALLAANLPFLTQRWFFILRRGDAKPFVIRLVEFALLYFALGFLARAVEARLGSVHPQGWEFYAVTVSLFLVFAYPGFVYRYLWRKKR